MGMFNEVFCSCPCCGYQCNIQVPQFVLGFGGFNLEVPKTLLELSYDDLNDLRSILDENHFHCEKCENYFLYSDREVENKLEYIKKLFG